MPSRLIHRPLVAVLASALTLFLATGAAADPRPANDHNDQPKPTIVLVHGAFADASSWTPVIDRLQNEGFPVIAPADPLRGPAGDSAYAASVLDTLSGPLVLVGHSYGGIVVSNAAAMTHNAQNVKALVFVAAFIPDVGETATDLQMLPGSLLGPTTQVIRPCSGIRMPGCVRRPHSFSRGHGWRPPAGKGETASDDAASGRGELVQREVAIRRMAHRAVFCDLRD